MGWVISFTPLSPYTRGKRPHYSSEGGWIPESVWTFWRREKSVAAAGNRTTSAWSSSPWRTVLFRLRYWKSVLPLTSAVLIYSCYRPGLCSTFGTREKTRTKFTTEILSLRGRARRRLQEHSIKMWTGFSWLSEVYWRVHVNTVMNCRVLYKAGTSSTSSSTVSLSRMTLSRGVKLIQEYPWAVLTLKIGFVCPIVAPPHRSCRGGGGGGTWKFSSFSVSFMAMWVTAWKERV
jgi:hypothetical protein